MSFEAFRQFALKAISVISLDLNELQKIADAGNERTSSSTTTIHTTQRPNENRIYKNEPHDISRCTIPIAMVCFSAVDMFGQWVNPLNDNDFKYSSGAFFGKLAGLNDLKNNATLDKFRDQFRHGIMHSFFAKNNFGVKYPEYENNSLFLDIDGKSDTLDVRYLLKAVRLGMANLTTEIRNEKSELSIKIFSGYKAWLRRQDGQANS